MDKLIVSEGIAGEFNNQLQTVSEFLNKCMNTINECTLLNQLEIENNNNEIKIEVYKQRNFIETLLNSVSIYEESIISQDNSNSQAIENMLDDAPTTDASKEPTGETVATTTEPKEEESIETIDGTVDAQVNTDVEQETTTTTTDSSIKGLGNNNGNNNSDYYYEEPQDNAPPVIDNNETIQDFYTFSTNLEDMINAGDLFANSEYNLTSYTNFLLYKYKIKDEEIAKKIYTALLNYGNNYSQTNNGFNPILQQDENSIIIGIYNILKQEENFDINTYPIFKGINITEA